MVDRDAMAAEARILGRYLIGTVPPPLLVERYGEAARAVLTDPETAFDRAVNSLALRRPWTVGPLEAGLGLSKPGAPLRRRLIVMAAVLETTPVFSERFTSLAPGPAFAALRLVTIGARASVKIFVGLVLLGWLRART